MKKEKDVRRIKSLPPMMNLVPFIMDDRNESCNRIHDTVNVTKLDRYVREKQQQGMKNMSPMHVIIAAYCRTVAKYPGLNRFIRGQRVWTRRSIDVCMTIKQEMSLEAPDTVIKLRTSPDVTTGDIYKSFGKLIDDYRKNPESDFDETASKLSRLPRILLRFIMRLLRCLDYVGLLPKSLLEVSPFHSSVYITSMGSLGIPAIYHHLYDFGTCPMFIAFGAYKRSYEVNPDGSVYKRRYMDITLTVDERTTDGYYYASAFKYFKQILQDPFVLDAPPENVNVDIS